MCSSAVYPIYMSARIEGECELIGVEQIVPYLLLWAIVLLISVFPYVVMSFMVTILTRSMSEISELVSKLKVITYLLGLTTFTKLGSVLLFDDGVAYWVDVLGTTLFAGWVTYSIYFVVECYKIAFRK